MSLEIPRKGTSAEPVPVSGDGTSIVSSIETASPDVRRVWCAAAAPVLSYATAVRLPALYATLQIAHVSPPARAGACDKMR